MNQQKKQTLCVVLMLVVSLASALYALPSLAMPSEAPAGMNTAASFMQTNVKPIAGTYSGSVIVTEPFPLGTLNLVFSIEGEPNALEGRIIPGKTQVFLGAPSITGSIETSDGVTPTIQLESEPFVDEVSGRQVQRHFSLTGEIKEDSNRLEGIYRETIEGFKPQPMEIVGTFSVVRPAGADVIIDVPPTATPTPTATSTLAPGQPTPTRTPIGFDPTATALPGEPTATMVPSVETPDPNQPTLTPPASGDPDGNPGGDPDGSGDGQRTILFLPLITTEMGEQNRVVSAQSANGLTVSTGSTNGVSVREYRAVELDQRLYMPVVSP